MEQEGVVAPHRRILDVVEVGDPTGSLDAVDAHFTWLKHLLARTPAMQAI